MHALDWVKTLVLAPLALVRFVLVLMILLFQYLLARIVVSSADVTQPLEGCARALQRCVFACFRLIHFVMGFYWCPTTHSPLRGERPVPPRVLVANHVAGCDHLKILSDMGWCVRGGVRSVGRV